MRWAQLSIYSLPPRVQYQQRLTKLTSSQHRTGEGIISPGENFTTLETLGGGGVHTKMSRRGLLMSQYAR